MRQDRIVDPRRLVYGSETPVLLEKTGKFVVVNHKFALRYRSNGGAEIEVTAGMDMAILGRRRLGSEEALQEIFSSPPGSPDHISSVPCDFDRDADVKLAYVGLYRLRLIAEAGHRAGIGVAAVRGVPIDIKEFSRNLNPKMVLRRLRQEQMQRVGRS